MEQGVQAERPLGNLNSRKIRGKWANLNEFKGGKKKVTQSYSIFWDPMYCLLPARLLCLWNSPGKNTGVLIPIYVRSK